MKVRWNWRKDKGGCKTNLKGSIKVLAVVSPDSLDLLAQLAVNVYGLNEALVVSVRFMEKIYLIEVGLIRWTRTL